MDKKKAPEDPILCSFSSKVKEGSKFTCKFTTMYWNKPL